MLDLTEMPLTEEQLFQLVDEIGEDEARILVYRMIIPLNEADALMAEEEALWWINGDETDFEIEDTGTEEYSDDEYGNMEDLETDGPDANGQTQELIIVDEIHYILWNGTDIYLDGAHVGNVINGAFIINGNRAGGRL